MVDTRSVYFWGILQCDHRPILSKLLRNKIFKRFRLLLVVRDMCYMISTIGPHVCLFCYSTFVTNIVRIRSLYFDSVLRFQLFSTGSA